MNDAPQTASAPNDVSARGFPGRGFPWRAFPWRTVLLAGCVLPLAATALSHPLRLILNRSASMPEGLYLALPADGARLQRGAIVLFALPPALQPLVYGRGWLPPGTPLMKTLGALAPDRYCVDANGLRINGVLRGPVLDTDAAGRPLPQIRGCHTVPEGHFLPLAEQHARSFDGRYIGTLPLSAVRALLHPLWTRPAGAGAQ
jgi:conjugative transfer signal peptidase TraF